MKIGEFAQLCHTNISLLHYYQKTGLLLPDYVDPFTGYRYYTSEQIPVFFRIRSLKQAGFELNEIKKMIAAQKAIPRSCSCLRKREKPCFALCTILSWHSK